jgi:hypothetical protein
LKVGPSSRRRTNRISIASMLRQVQVIEAVTVVEIAARAAADVLAEVADAIAVATVVVDEAATEVMAAMVAAGIDTRVSTVPQACYFDARQRGICCSETKSRFPFDSFLFCHSLMAGSHR